MNKIEKFTKEEGDIVKNLLWTTNWRDIGPEIGMSISRKIFQLIDKGE